MRWKKLGRLFDARGQRPWMASHAAMPVAEPVAGDLWRIYFTTRDSSNRSHVAAGILDLSRPSQLVDLESDPVVGPGDLGCFDDSGATCTWLVSCATGTYLYYVGWNLGVTVPFRNALGVALRRPGEHKFTKLYRGPILDRTSDEPHFVASCAVVPGREGHPWRMWYLSCTGWTVVDGKPRHDYHIKYAESTDGLEWKRNGHVAIDYADPSEYAISRPSVLRESGIWHMWYSHRGDSYRIGYAQSDDGLTWRRMDSRAGIDVSPGCWDGEMIEYPCVFRHRETLYMLYNGNGYGATGLGLAVYEE